ncbi:MAG: hypothetical protein EA397_09520 [Deltaproteobacteria bacterium]|nr:MAG: hypothetical protein EA397_09520 [Deltaproteobacteria bacterium]
MLLYLLSALAFANTPAHVDLENVDLWAEGADTLLDGPPGCWEVVGRATWAWDLGKYGFNRGDSVIVGRLFDGIWTGFSAISLGEVQRKKKGASRHVYPDALRVVPMLGRVDESVRRDSRRSRSSEPSGSGEAVNLIRTVLDDVGGDVEVSWATWEDTAQAVVYHRGLEVGAGRNPPEATVRVRFPNGGDVPDALEIEFPESWKTQTFPRAKITSTSVKVRGQIVEGVAFPASEAVKADATVLGMTFSGAQTIDYRSFTPCTDEVRAQLEEGGTRVDLPE